MAKASILFVAALVAVVLASGCIQAPPEYTEINLEDQGLSVRIAPTIENKVSGLISLYLKNVPEDTVGLVMIMSPKEMDPQTNLTEEPNVIMEFMLPDVDELIIDTTDVENGLYDLGVVAGAEGAEMDTWIASVSTELIVEN